MIRVALTYECGGCDAKATAEACLVREFTSVSGRDYGIGQWATVWPDEIELAPEGWLASDPYTQRTYCPACWAKIEKEASDD